MTKENGMIMISEEEYNKTINDLEKKANKYRRLMFNLIEKSHTFDNKDIEISRQNFVDLYQAAVDDMFDMMEKGEDNNNNPIYGNDITVHWNGVFCNCTDGAVAYNYILPAIQGVIDETD